MHFGIAFAVVVFDAQLCAYYSPSKILLNDQGSAFSTNHSLVLLHDLPLRDFLSHKGLLI